MGRYTPNSSAISCTVISTAAYRRLILVSSSAESSGLLPPTRPLALAAARPSLLLPTMRLLSNSANARIMVKNYSLYGRDAKCPSHSNADPLKKIALVAN